MNIFDPVPESEFGHHEDLYDRQSGKRAVERIHEMVGDRIWKSFYPRRIIPQQYYVGPDLVSAVNIAAQMSETSPLKDKCILHMGAICAKLLVNRFPTYFVGEDLTLAILKTDPDPSMMMSDLIFPVEAFTLMFPITDQVRDAMNGRHIGYIQCAHIPAGFEWICGVLSPHKVPVVSPVEKVMFATSIQVKGTSAIDVTSDSPMTRSIASMTGLSMVPGPSMKGAPPELLTREFDMETTRLYFRLLSGTLAVMNSRPNLVEVFTEPQRPQRISKSGVVERDALWSPNFIGRTYQIKREPLGGHHASPRLHQRRGHFRHQPYGPGRSLNKMIWIEPVWIG